MAVIWWTLLGALFAWVLAFASTISIALLSAKLKIQVFQETRRKLYLLASGSLIFIAINIVSPFPFLSEKLAVFAPDVLLPLQGFLELLTLRDLLITGIVMGGLPVIFLTTKEGRAVTSEGDPSRILKIMTWLGPPLQIWVFALGTTLLLELGGVLVTGLFILSGPGAWQFAILMSAGKPVRESAVRITRIMIVSLGLTLGFALYGLGVGQLTSATGAVRVDQVFFPYLASISLIVVSYFFFYSFWGERWSESRPIATIAAVILFTFLISVKVRPDSFQLSLSALTWILLFTLPFMLYDREYLFRVIQCAECQAEADSSAAMGAISHWKESYSCTRHPEAKVVLEAKYWHSISFLRRLWLLPFGIFHAPWRRNLRVTIDPEKTSYKVGDPYRLEVKITKRIRHTAMAEIFVLWKTESRTIAASSKIIGKNLRSRSEAIQIRGSVPPITWPRRRPLANLEPITVVVKAGITGYRPVANELRFPLVIHVRRKIKLDIERP